MRLWLDCPVRVAPLIFFDIETTGLRPDRGARVSEAAVLDGQGVRLAWQCGAEDAGGNPFARVLPDLLDRLAAGIVVGHNLRFDLRFVAYEAERLGRRGPDVQAVDTLALARRLLPAAADHRLETLARHLGIAPEGGGFHTALGDAQATRSLFWKLVALGEIQTLAEAGVQRLGWSTF